MSDPHNKDALRDETCTKQFRSLMADNLGCVCANCGSTENIQYHHIVPLSLGGTNKLSNIVPLCWVCHKAAHNGQNIQYYRKLSQSNNWGNAGRPAKCDDETAFRALDLLLDGRIGNIRCKELMHLSGSTFPKHVVQYKKWAKARGVVDMFNYIDHAISHGAEMYPGRVVGWVIFDTPDREKQDILFKGDGDDLGEDD